MKLIVSNHNGWRERRTPSTHHLLPSPAKRAAEARHHDENMFDFTQHWAYAFVGTAVALVALMAVSVYVIIKRRRKATSPLTPEPPKHASIHCPPLTIELSANRQQPAAEEMGRTVPQPVRIKARGLLERRGSNASLTIELNQPDSALSWGTPPKECSAEEYLNSAGNRITRRQLRDCIKNLKLLQQEFLDIPLNHPAKLDLPGCSNKNRYKSIWPNEATRVHLSQLPQRPGEAASASSTYINANFIRGYDGEEKAFIATQGPLPNTVADFWLMVWSENCSCIVMMTKLKEKNRIKCEPYLPTREADYGPIHVTVRTTTAKNGYYVRDVVIQRENNVKQVKHFWFTGWPDHKAPSSTARQLLAMAQEVEAERRKRLALARPAPVVVHCSAGIGRSGCFVGTCIGMRQLREENMADILGIVCQMRVDRGGIIQTPEQYEFLHYALALYERELPETPTSAALPLTSSNSTSTNSSPGS